MVRLATFAARNVEQRAQAEGGLSGGAAAAEPELGETPEAQEASLVAQYQSALLSAAEGRTQHAVEMFQAVLRHPLVSAESHGTSNIRGTLRELRFLATRNLADQLGLLEEQQQQQQQQLLARQEQGQQLPSDESDERTAGICSGNSDDGGSSITALRLQLYGDAVLQLHADVKSVPESPAGTYTGAGDAVLWHRLADVAIQDGRAGLARYALECGLAASHGRHVVLLEKLLQLQLRADDVAGALGSCRRLEALDPCHPWLLPGSAASEFHSSTGRGGVGNFVGNQSLQSQLLRLVDPGHAALEEFLERQRLEQGYVFGYGYGPPYDAANGGSTDGDGASAVGLPLLEAPALEGRLPDALPAKRRRLAASPSAEDTAHVGCHMLELELPVVISGSASQLQTSSSPPAAAASAVVAEAGAALGLDNRMECGPRSNEQPLYDGVALLTAINRVLRGLSPSHGTLNAAFTHKREAEGGGSERLFGAVLHLTPASAKRLETASGALLQADERHRGQSPADLTTEVPTAERGIAQGPGASGIAIDGGCQVVAAAVDGVTSDSVEVMGEPEGPSQPNPRAQRQGGGAARGLAAAMSAAATEPAPVRTSARRAARGAAAAAVAAGAAIVPAVQVVEINGNGTALGTVHHAAAATVAARSRVVGTGGSSAVSASGAVATCEDPCTVGQAWQRLWQQLQRSVGLREEVPAAMAPRPGSTTVGTYVSPPCPDKPPPLSAVVRGFPGPASWPTRMPPANADMNQNVSRQSALPASGSDIVPTIRADAAGGSNSGAALPDSPCRKGGGGLPLSRMQWQAKCPTQVGRGTILPEEGIGGDVHNDGEQQQQPAGLLSSSNQDTMAVWLNPCGDGLIGQCLLDGAAVLTVATAALLRVLVDPFSLRTSPALVYQVLLLEPYVSHALCVVEGRESDIDADAAMSRFALLAALHLEQGLLLQEAEGDGDSDGRDDQAAVSKELPAAVVATDAGPTTKPQPGRLRPQSKAKAAAAATARPKSAGSSAHPNHSGGAAKVTASAIVEANGLCCLGPYEHFRRAEYLLSCLLAEAVMLGMGLAPPIVAEELPEVAAVMANINHHEAPVSLSPSSLGGTGAAKTDRTDCGPTAEEVDDDGGGGVGVTERADGAVGSAAEGAPSGGTAPIVVHHRAMSMYLWLRGQLLERESNVLGAQESYLRCLEILPAPAVPIDTSPDEDGVAPPVVEAPSSEPPVQGRAVAGFSGGTAALAGCATSSGNSGVDGDVHWHGCWSLPGCCVLRPPTAAAVRARVSALEVFRTMAEAEQAAAAGEHEQVVTALSDVAFPPRQAASRDGMAVASLDIEDLPSSGVNQVTTAGAAVAAGEGAAVLATVAAARNQARVQVRAVQLLRGALVALLQPSSTPLPVHQVPQQRQQPQGQQELQNELHATIDANVPSDVVPAMGAAVAQTAVVAVDTAVPKAATVATTVAVQDALSLPQPTAITAAAASGAGPDMELTPQQVQPHIPAADDGTAGRERMDHDQLISATNVRLQPSTGAGGDGDAIRLEDQEAVAEGTAVAAEADAAVKAVRHRVIWVTQQPYLKMLLRCNLALLCYNLRHVVEAAMKPLEASTSVATALAAATVLRGPVAEVRECVIALRTCRRCGEDTRTGAAATGATCQENHQGLADVESLEDVHGRTDVADILPEECLPWVRQLTLRLMSYLQSLQVVSGLVEPPTVVTGLGGGVGGHGPSRLNCRVQLSKSLRSLMLDVSLGILACYRLDPLAACSPEACHSFITGLLTVLCCSRPGLAVAVAGGHVASAAPQTQQGAAGPALNGPAATASGGGGAAAAAASAAAAVAAAPWELAPVFREALQLLQPHVQALASTAAAAAPSRTNGEIPLSVPIAVEIARGSDPETDLEVVTEMHSGGSDELRGASDGNNCDTASARDAAGCRWPGFLALQVLALREVDDETDGEEEEEGEEADGGAPPRDVAGAQMPGLDFGNVGTSTPLDGSVVLPNLKSLPPLKAAARVMLAVERGGRAVALLTAAAEAEEVAVAERRVAALQRLCGAQAQLLWLLFGVDFPWRDRSWGFGLSTAAAAAEAATAEDATDTPFVPSTKDALLLWEMVEPHAVLLAHPPEVPGMSADSRAAMESGFSAQLKDLLPSLDFLVTVVPPLPEAARLSSCAHRFLHSANSVDNLLLALHPEEHLPEWLREPLTLPPSQLPSPMRQQQQREQSRMARVPEDRDVEMPSSTGGELSRLLDMGGKSPETKVEVEEARGKLRGWEFLAMESRRQQEADSHWKIHRWLYFCVLRARGLDADPLQTHQQRRGGGGSGGGGAGSAPAAAAAASLLCAGSESSEELAANAEVVLSDLALNPMRMQSWGALQAIYLEAVRRLLNEAALFLESTAFRLQPHSQSQQPQQEGLTEQARGQLARLWRLAVRSGVASVRTDPDPESRAFRLEQLAVLLYEIVVPCCPLYDNLDGDTSAVVVAEGRRVVGVCDVSITAATTSGALAILSSALTPPPRVLQYGRQLEGVGVTADEADELSGNSCRTSYMAVVRRDWRYQAACAVAEDLWSRAALALSEEWQYEYFMGLVAIRRKAPGWRSRCLDHLAAAAVLAAAEPQYDGGGLLAPLVTLHSRRLLWMAKAEAQRRRRERERRRAQCSGIGGGGCSATVHLDGVDTAGGDTSFEDEDRHTKEDAWRHELLALCGRYCFSRDLALRLHPCGNAHSSLPTALGSSSSVPEVEPPAAVAPAAAAWGASAEDTVVHPTVVPEGPIQTHELWDLLFEDARQALIFAIRSYKAGKEHHHYHPARYALARCDLLLGQLDDAELQLRPLFTPFRGRAAFALSVGRVGDRGFGQLRRKAAAAARAAGRKQKRKLVEQQQQQRAGKAAQQRHPQQDMSLNRAQGHCIASHGSVGRREGRGEEGPGGPQQGVSAGLSSPEPDDMEDIREGGEEETDADAEGGTDRPVKRRRWQQEPSKWSGPGRQALPHGESGAAMVAHVEEEEEEGEDAGDDVQYSPGQERPHKGCNIAGDDGGEEAGGVEPNPKEPGNLRRGQPTALWATEPQMVIGHGLEESEREHVTALRKCLALYLQLIWERADQTTLQAAVPVLYGVADKMPYIRDLAAVALGLMSTGAAVAACSALGLSLEEVAEGVARAGDQSPPAVAAGEGGTGSGDGTDIAAQPGSAEAWLSKVLDERLQQRLATARAAAVATATATAATAAMETTAAAESSAVAVVAVGVDDGERGDGGERHPMLLDGPAAAPTPASPAGGSGQGQAQQHHPPLEGQGDSVAVAEVAAVGGEGILRSCTGPHIQTRLAYQHQHQQGGTREAGASVRTGRATAAVAPTAAAASAGTATGGATPAGRTGLASVTSWMTLLDALAPLCALNFDYWTDSVAAGIAPAKPNVAAAAAQAACAGHRYQRQVPGEAAAAVLREPLLRCFSLQYIQALRLTPEIGPQRLQELLRRLGRRHRASSRLVAAGGLRQLVRAVEDAIAGPQGIEARTTTAGMEAPPPAATLTAAAATALPAPTAATVAVSPELTVAAKMAMIPQSEAAGNGAPAAVGVLPPTAEEARMKASLGGASDGSLSMAKLGGKVVMVEGQLDAVEDTPMEERSTAKAGAADNDVVKLGGGGDGGGGGSGGPAESHGGGHILQNTAAGTTAAQSPRAARPEDGMNTQKQTSQQQQNELLLLLQQQWHRSNSVVEALRALPAPQPLPRVPDVPQQRQRQRKPSKGSNAKTSAAARAAGASTAPAPDRAGVHAASTPSEAGTLWTSLPGAETQDVGNDGLSGSDTTTAGVTGDAKVLNLAPCPNQWEQLLRQYIRAAELRQVQELLATLATQSQPQSHLTTQLSQQQQQQAAAAALHLLPPSRSVGLAEMDAGDTTGRLPQGSFAAADGHQYQRATPCGVAAEGLLAHDSSLAGRAGAPATALPADSLQWRLGTAQLPRPPLTHSAATCPQGVAPMVLQPGWVQLGQVLQLQHQLQQLQHHHHPNSTHLLQQQQHELMTSLQHQYIQAASNMTPQDILQNGALQFRLLQQQVQHLSQAAQESEIRSPDGGQRRQLQEVLAATSGRPQNITAEASLPNRLEMAPQVPNSRSRTVLEQEHKP